MTEEEEKKGRTAVEVRWRDCFKFWIAGFIFQTVLTVFLLAWIMTMMPGS